MESVSVQAAELSGIVMADARLRVLVVDDDVIWRQLIVGWLERTSGAAFDVQSADSYQSGLDVLVNGSFDVCIVDHRLSRDLTGLDLLGEARRAGCDTPMLLLTASAEEELDVTALRAGAADYLEKTGLTIELTARAIRHAIERHRVQQALRESEARYRAVFEHAPHGICRSRNEHFTAVNPALVQMLGYPSARELMAIDVRNDLFQDARQFEEAFAALRRDGYIRDIEAEWRRRDGRLIIVRFTVHQVSAAGDADWIYEAIVEDITDQRRLELQFRQSQKMEAVGRLAGGVAHDFNNLLTAILGYGELLRDQLSRDGQADLEEVLRAGNRAADLTRQLLAFSRKQVMRPAVCDLGAVVDGACGMLRRVIGEDITFTVSRLDQPVWVNVDSGQIEQVLMNLAVNARDAMPNGGTLAIDTSTSVIARETARDGQMPAGSYALISVRDTGCGIDEDTKSHLFEPFFTTKEVGKGTGLGLATVYGIVKQSGGFIWVDSEPAAGTTFWIYLPIVAAPDEPARDKDCRSPLRSGQETILLVEDEDGVRRLAGRILQRCGYEVLSASNAEEARLLHGERGLDIALLLTDVVMPGTSGPALARSLLAGHRALRVLYMSGYAERGLIEQTGFAGAPFLPKPFTPDSLAQRVRDVLDQPVAASKDARRSPIEGMRP